MKLSSSFWNRRRNMKSESSRHSRKSISVRARFWPLSTPDEIVGRTSFLSSRIMTPLKLAALNEWLIITASNASYIRTPPGRRLSNADGWPWNHGKDGSAFRSDRLLCAPHFKLTYHMSFYALLPLNWTAGICCPLQHFYQYRNKHRTS